MIEKRRTGRSKNSSKNIIRSRTNSTTRKSNININHLESNVSRIDSGVRRKRSDKRKKRNKILTNIFLLIFICIFIYSSYNVFMWLKSDRKLKKLEEGLYKEVIENVKPNKLEIENEEEQEQVKKGTFSVDFSKLKEINPDVIGWIKINETYINYPILQGKTNEYYLKKDIYGAYDFSGSIFVYSDVNKNFEDENTVIYGHNMNNQRMFAHLQKIYDGELGKNINVEISTESGNHNYKVFSCYIDAPNLDIIKNKFSEQEKKEYIDNSVRKSKINFNQDIDYSSKIITLITCGSTSKERIIVNAIEEKY